MTWRLYQIRAEPVQVSSTPAAVSVASWSQRWAEPVRQGPLVSQQQFLAYTGIVTPVVVTSIGWLQPFGEPVRVRQLPVSEQQSLAYAKAPALVDWFQPLGEPPRRQPSSASQRDFFAYTRAPALVDWLQPLSLPLRRAGTLQDFLLSTPPTGPAISPSYGWYGPLSVPLFTISRRALVPEWFYPTLIQVAPAVSVAAWNEWWSEPARLRPGYAPYWAQSDATMPIIPIPTPPATGAYTVSGLYVIDQFTDNTVAYDYSGGVSHRTN